MQEIVGGPIELMQVRNGYQLYWNEEGSVRELEPNIGVGNVPVVGTLFICRYKEEFNVGMTKEEVLNFVDNFEYYEYKEN